MISDLRLSSAPRADAPAIGFAARLGRLAVRQYALCVLIVLLFTAFNVFVGLGQSRIDDSDEARYGVSAYEMVQNRSFLVTTYAGQPEYWNLKPPLGYWPMALAFYLFGVSPLTLRLPSALFALGTVALTMAFCRRTLNRRVALAAGLIVATTFGFFSHHGARSGDLDSALTFVLLLAICQVPRLAASPGRVIAFAGLLAIGFLLKSFAILPILLVALLYLGWTGSWRRLNPTACAGGAALFLALVGAWAMLRWHVDGTPYFLQRMVGEDLFARSTRQIDKGSTGTWTYLTSLLDRFAPWPLLLIGALLARGLAGWRREGESWSVKGRRAMPLLLLWIAVPLVLFSVARTHHHWYLDPLYPALAAATACTVLALLGRISPARRGIALLAFFVLPLALCEARVLQRVLVRDRMPDSQRFLISLGNRHAELGTTLRAAKPLYHSERFILQAMDGYRVVDGPDVGPPFGASPEMPLLSRLPGVGHGLQPAPDFEVLAESKTYTLYGNSSLDLEATRLRAAPGRPPQHHLPLRHRRGVNGWRRS
jgi:4-amino-4-deoxy-L-arabinose transferase-like glycosyltransferase